MKISQLTQTVC